MINDYWKSIKTEVMKKPLDSMSGRIKTLLKEKSGHAKYMRIIMKCMLHFCKCTIVRIMKK